jgi:hypothetical protein
MPAHWVYVNESQWAGQVLYRSPLLGMENIRSAALKYFFSKDDSNGVSCLTSLKLHLPHKIKQVYQILVTASDISAVGIHELHSPTISNSESIQFFYFSMDLQGLVLCLILEWIMQFFFTISLVWSICLKNSQISWKESFVVLTCFDGIKQTKIPLNRICMTLESSVFYIPASSTSCKSKRPQVFDAWLLTYNFYYHIYVW